MVAERGKIEGVDFEALNRGIAKKLETEPGEITDVHRAVYCIAKMLECSSQNQFLAAQAWYEKAERFRDDAILSIPVLSGK